MTDYLKEYTNRLNTILANKALFYFSREVERSLGLETLLPNLRLVHIVKSQFTKYLSTTGIKYYCLEDDEPINSVSGGARKLLMNENSLNYINQNSLAQNYAQTFKISPKFEKLSQEKNFLLLNTSARLNRLFEDKITQYEKFQGKVNFPKTIIAKMEDFTYLQLVQKLGERFVIQFSRGHTGTGTSIIDTEEQFEQIKKQTLQRQARFSSYIEGITYTLNACLTSKGVYVGGLSLQITGAEELTGNKGATIGNDWSRRTFLDKIDDLAVQVGALASIMKSEGFRGMFGVDFVVTDKGQVFVIEVNARQTASTPTYTKIQLTQGEVPLSMLHLLEFMELDIELDPGEYNKRNIQPVEYSQIFLRAKQQNTVNHEIEMGIYRLQGDNAAINRYTDEVKSTTLFLDEDRDKALLFQKYAATLADMDRKGILVLTPVAGRIIAPGEELARIKLNQSAVNPMGEVYPWIIESLKAIEHHQL